MNTVSYQLRRIGLAPSIEEVKNVYSINEDTTFIGRGKCVDIYLDSSIRKGLISRAHAHVTRSVSNGEVVFRMYDTSLNGTYVNDVRIKESHILKDGDKIAFGHLRGALIDPGEIAVQKETEFLFKFECCTKEEIVDLISEQQKSSVFLSPKSVEVEGNPSSLLGLHQTFDYEKRNEYSKKVLSDYNKHNECEFQSIISNITSKIHTEESSENELNIDIQLPNLSKDVNHLILPCQRLFKQRDENTSPSASTISSDVDIKRDTSLSLTHVYEDVVEYKQRLPTLKKKVTAVLNGHGCNEVVDVASSKTSDSEIIEELYDEVGVNKLNSVDDKESFCSDKSEEITDSDDSDYLPSSHSDSQTSSPRRRTRKAPQRFSPVSNRTSKKIKLNSKPATENTMNNRKDFTHDRCAAWDCIIPSGTIKQITWVACDDCDAWYHVTCSGLTASVAKRPETKYHCGCL